MKGNKSGTGSIDAQHFATEVVKIAEPFQLRVVWVTARGKAHDLGSKSCLDIRMSRQDVDRPGEGSRRRFMTWKRLSAAYVWTTTCVPTCGHEIQELSLSVERICKEDGDLHIQGAPLQSMAARARAALRAST